MFVYQGHADQKWGCSIYSQHGEDIVLLNIFSQLGITQPNFLDLGAHHPMISSNTYLLYSKLGSRGLNVEANPNLIEAFRTVRPFDTTINFGVAAKPGINTFYFFDEYSGRNTFSKAETEANRAAYGMQVTAQSEVECLTVNQLVDQYFDGKFPALLNVDLEGVDHEVLRSVDFSRSSPAVLCVETGHGTATAEMSDMLGAVGFGAYVRIGENVIYVREDFLCELNRKMGAM